MRAYRFITTTSADGLSDSGTRRQAHREAARNRHRERRLQRMRSHENDHRHETPLNRSANLAVSFVDPFQSLALPLSARDQDNLTYFREIIGPALLPLETLSSWAEEWLQYSVSSPVLLAAVCGHVLEHRDFAAERKPRPAAYEYRILAVRGVSIALQEKTDVPSDEAMGAIVLLIANELLSGNIRELGMHMAAMTRLTAQRRTTQLSGFSGMIVMTQKWHAAPARLLCNNVEAQIDPADLDVAESEDPMSSIDEVLTHCRELTVQLSRPPGGRNHAWGFSHHRSWLESQLVKRCLHRSSTLPTDLPVSVQTCVDDLVYTAATVYVFCKLRRYSVNGPTVQKIYSQLLSGLKDVMENFMFDQITRLGWQSILWASMVARMCAQDHPRDEYITALIETAVRRLALASVADVVASLQRFVWPEGWGASELEQTMYRV